jgi:hypothetical protein
MEKFVIRVIIIISYINILSCNKKCEDIIGGPCNYDTLYGQCRIVKIDTTYITDENIDSYNINLIFHSDNTQLNTSNEKFELLLLRDDYNKYEYDIEEGDTCSCILLHKAICPSTIQIIDEECKK